MKKLNRLSARTVATLTKPGRHADGGNLYLVVDKGGAKRWVFLFHLHNHQHEAGLGSLNSVPLAKAREISADFRGYLAAGLNPIIERRNHRPVRHKTFGQMAQDFLTAHEAGWSNTKHKQQWRTTLETYAAPLWDLPVDQVDTTAILAILKPLWSTIPGRVRQPTPAPARQWMAPPRSHSALPKVFRGHLGKLMHVTSFSQADLSCVNKGTWSCSRGSQRDFTG